MRTEKPDICILSFSLNNGKNLDNTENALANSQNWNRKDKNEFLGKKAIKYLEFLFPTVKMVKNTLKSFLIA